MYFQEKCQKLLQGTVKILLNVQLILIEISFKKFPFIKGIFLIIMVSISSVIATTDIDGIYLQYFCVYCIPLTCMSGRALLALYILQTEKRILNGITIKSEGISGVLYSINCSTVRIALNSRCSLAFVLFLVTIVFLTVLQAAEH